MEESKGKSEFRRLLIVEDDLDHAELLRDTLLDANTDVDVTPSGEDCMKHEIPAYDAILLDYNLPDVQGMSLLQELLKHSQGPVIMVTGEDATQVAMNAMNVGAFDYICKAGDYLRAIPMMVDKNIERYRIARDNERLRKELEEKLEKIREQNRILEKLSTTDWLTDLYNHRYLHERFEEELNRARRFGRALGCIMIDIDRFKRVNDTYGHLFGDIVLRGIGKILRENSRNYDIASRYGGEEFLMVLPETNLKGATEIAHRLQRRVEETVFTDGNHDVRITASFGVAGLEPPDSSSKDELIGWADRALYEAKQSGRNRVSSWPMEKTAGRPPL